MVDMIVAEAVGCRDFGCMWLAWRLGAESGGVDMILAVVALEPRNRSSKNVSGVRDSVELKGE